MHAARTRGEVLVRHAKGFAKAVPAKLEHELKANPYRALGIACVVGIGAGTVLGSRILRGALSGAASLVIVELGWQFLRQDATEHRGGPDAEASLRPTGASERR